MITFPRLMSMGFADEVIQYNLFDVIAKHHPDIHPYRIDAPLLDAVNDMFWPMDYGHPKHPETKLPGDTTKTIREFMRELYTVADAAVPHFLTIAAGDFIFGDPYDSCYVLLGPVHMIDNAVLEARYPGEYAILTDIPVTNPSTIALGRDSAQTQYEALVRALTPTEKLEAVRCP